MLVCRRSREHFVVGILDEPVEVFAGVIVPVAQELQIGAIRHVFHKLVDNIRFGSPFDAQVFLDLGTYDAEVAGHGYYGVGILRLLLDNNDFGAFFRSRFCGSGACQTVTDYHHVAVFFRRNLSGDFGGGEEGRLERHYVAARGGRFAGGSRLGAARRCTSGKSRSGCSSGHRTKSEERATAEVLFGHFPLLSIFFETLSLLVPNKRIEQPNDAGETLGRIRV